MSGWRKQLADFLTATLQAQQEAVALLERKREMFAKNDLTAVGELSKDEQAASERLQHCLLEREKLLQYATAEGLPAQSIEILAKAVVPYSDDEFFALLRSVRFETQKLRQNNIANWCITQRGMLHTSQMLEIIATRGRMRSTYTRSHQRNIGPTGGSLVDRKA